MQLIKSEKKDGNVTELEILVERDAFEAACEKAYHKNVRSISVQGFRKGKAPRKIIEKIYGPGIFYEEAINICYPEAYNKAMEQSGIEPVDQPEINITNVSADGFSFKAIVTTKPEVVLSKYKGIEAEKRTVSVSDADIDDEIQHTAQRNARIVRVDRPIGEGDTVVFDFEGFVDGAPFEGGKAERYSLKIGSGQFIPGFESQLIGAASEQELDVNVTFPDDYHVPELAGKPAVFKCKIHEVSESVLPEIDDEFVKDVSEFDTMAQYRESIKTRLLESRGKHVESEFEDSILEKVIEGMTADIPPVMIEHQLDRYVDDYAYRLSMQGMTMEAYLKMNEMNIESFRQLFREQAERQVKSKLALEAIAKLENFTVTEQDLEAEYKRIADQYKTEVEKIKTTLQADALVADIRLGRAIDLIKEHAVPLEKKTEAPQAKGGDQPSEGGAGT